jgi:hypothetical protein
VETWTPPGRNARTLPYNVRASSSYNLFSQEKKKKNDK